MNHGEQRVLELLSRQFPDLASATTEIINLSAILELPKGCEHFFSDLHGEYEAFCHMLKNASGLIRLKIEEVFSHLLTTEEQDALATLIYYPEERLSYLQKDGPLSDDWFRVTLYRLVQVCRGVASKYTRSKVRKALPKEFCYIIEELLHEGGSGPDKDAYYRGILETILRTKRQQAFLTAICQLISRLSVDHLHILGDIFDRGPGAHVILDTLLCYHSVDIAWGNHDILWMGAAAGNPACMATVLRICARYNNLDTVENGYGIGLRQLFSFGEAVYGDHLIPAFFPVGAAEITPSEQASVTALHQAISVIGWKLEADIIKRHPEYEMEDRLLLDKLGRSQKNIVINGVSYPVNDGYFPTVDPDCPTRLSREEEEIVNRLKDAFMGSHKLQKHVKYLFSKGGMYQVMNGNLMYHGCIPLTKSGNFASFLGHRGKSLLDYCDNTLRKGFFLPEHHPEKESCVDFYWYLWCGTHSPLFGKSQMKTFERYYLSDPATHREDKNPYYRLIEGESSRQLVAKILKEFSLSEETSHIINGHVPVRQSCGESPLKAGGRLFMIDGGLSRAYQGKTGIGGYTLMYHSRGFLLTAHEPFSNRTDAVEEGRDIVSTPVATEQMPCRLRVADTDTGKELSRRISELFALADAYREGRLPQPGNSLS
ncbi:MAG: fructose-1,6-bisphosphatase [Clostridia bacterium]|nr:fructose-1,6-bisphosphatase [Clostridia bacterium]